MVEFPDQTELEPEETTEQIETMTPTKSTRAKAQEEELTQKEFIE